MAANLAPIYVNDARVTLQGDPKPQVSKIVQAMGKQPNSCEVVRLRKQSDVQGKTLNPEDFIDRTQAPAPVYLKVIDRNVPSSAGLAGKASWSSSGGAAGSSGSVGGSGAKIESPSTYSGTSSGFGSTGSMPSKQQTGSQGNTSNLQGLAPPGKGKTPRDDDPTFGEEE